MNKKKIQKKICFGWYMMFFKENSTMLFSVLLSFDSVHFVGVCHVTLVANGQWTWVEEILTVGNKAAFYILDPYYLSLWCCNRNLRHILFCNVLGFDTSGLSSEEMMKLNSGLDYILDIVGDTIPESLIKVPRWISELFLLYTYQFNLGFTVFLH